MVFSSAVFLFAFFPIVLAGYHMVRGSLKNDWLLCASLLFYAWERPRFLLILLASIAVNYLSALWIDKVPCGEGGKGISVRKALPIIIKYLQLLLEMMAKKRLYSFESIEKLTR